MNKILTAITFLLFACATCLGQTSYKGLTPGKSTRAHVERVLGQPVKEVSKTLIEYKLAETMGQLFVQYRDASPAAVIERIEIACPDYACGRASFVHPSEKPDAKLEPPEGWWSATPPFKRVWYWGAPRFVVYTELWKADNPNPKPDAEVRLGFYSKELYESAVPK